MIRFSRISSGSSESISRKSHQWIYSTVRRSIPYTRRKAAPDQPAVRVVIHRCIAIDSQQFVRGTVPLLLLSSLYKPVQLQYSPHYIIRHTLIHQPQCLQELAPVFPSLTDNPVVIKYGTEIRLNRIIRARQL